MDIVAFPSIRKRCRPEYEDSTNSWTFTNRKTGEIEYTARPDSLQDINSPFRFESVRPDFIASLKDESQKRAINGLFTLHQKLGH